MHLDVTDLYEFYTHNPLGATVQQRLNARICKFWSPDSSKTLVGYGYATPVLSPFLDKMPRLLALMPAPQGVVSWPQEGTNKTVLGEETRWPFGAGQIDRLIILHGLETSERPASLLEECHRILCEDGEAIFILPNRAGLWARFDSTPFGVGRPYSGHQLEKLLQKAGFHIIERQGALFMPPLRKKITLGLRHGVRFFGRTLPFIFPPGLWLVHVKRQTLGINAPTSIRKSAKIMLPLKGKGLCPT